MHIPTDKAFHFIGGWALAATLFPYFPLLAIFSVVFFAALKEWWDGKGHGNKEFLDFLVTVIGGLGAAITHDFISTALTILNT